MKLKKLALLTVSALVAATLFSACSAAEEDTAPTKTMDEMFEIIDAVNAIDNPRELTDMNIQLDFMLDEESIVAYTGVASNDGDNAGMTLILEVADGTAEDVINALELYAENQVMFWSNYEEFAVAVESVENSMISQSGNYIIQVFASNDGEGYDAIETAIDDALS